MKRQTRRAIATNARLKSNRPPQLGKRVTLPATRQRQQLKQRQRLKQRLDFALERDAALLESTVDANASLATFMKKRRLYDLLYLDPPWSYGKKKYISPNSCSPIFHYPLMLNDELLSFAAASFI